MEKVMAFLKEEEGVTAIEYGLIAALIALAIVAVVPDLRDKLKDVFTKITDSLGDALG